MANLAVAVTARDAGGLVGTGSGVITTTTFADGLAGAPSGQPQRPTLLNGYSFRPPWNVAGVEYRVGVQTGVTLKNPATATLPAGVSRDSFSKWFVITGNNVVLDGWDFSLDGGWKVQATTGSNPTIRNCKLKVGARNQCPIEFMGSANSPSFGTGATLEYNDVDGSNLTTGLATLILLSRSGTFSVRYNWVRNAFSDWLHMGADTFASGKQTTYDIRFNLFEQAGQTTDPNAHSDWLQTFANGNYGNIVVEFNTFVQTSTPNGTQGAVLQANGNTPLSRFSGGSVSNNTVIMTALPVGCMNLGFAIALDVTSGTWTCANNYGDPKSLTLASDFIREDSTGGSLHGALVKTGNTNMLNGTALS